jgi:hypothetical protein
MPVRKPPLRYWYAVCPRTLGDVAIKARTAKEAEQKFREVCPCLDKSEYQIEEAVWFRGLLLCGEEAQLQKGYRT